MKKKKKSLGYFVYKKYDTEYYKNTNYHGIVCDIPCQDILHQFCNYA